MGDADTLHARNEFDNTGQPRTSVFSYLSEMKQNQSNLDMFLSEFCRIPSNTVKYRETWLNAKGKRA